MSVLPPRPDAAEQDAPSVGASTLFSSRDVLVATLLGSVIAGSTLLALNYLALRRQPAAVRSLVLGGGTGVALILAVVMLGDGLPGGPLSLAVVAAGTAVAMRLLAEALQGRALSAHRDAGGRVGAPWRSVVVGTVGRVT